MTEGLSERLLYEGTCDPTVAVLERMDRYEVEMRDPDTSEGRENAEAGEVALNQSTNASISRGTTTDGGASK
jgi:hypothetical protein